MVEEWKIKGKLLQEVESLRERITQLEQDKAKEEDESLEKSNEGFGPMFDDIAEGVFLINLETKQSVTGNKAICKMLGCQREEIVNLRVQDVYPQEASCHMIEHVETHANGKPLLANNIPIKKQDGSILFTDITLVPLTLAGKKYILNVVREASPKKNKRTRQPNASADSFDSPHVTTAEVKVLKLIVKGMSSKEIARLLHRSPRTIENHRAHLMKKLGVDNSVDLIRRAITIGLIDLSTESQQKSTD